MFQALSIWKPSNNLPSATVYWFMQIQNMHFPRVKAILLNKESWLINHPSTKLILDLGLYLDTLMRVIHSKGRLQHTHIENRTKNPVLLSPMSLVTKLLINYNHVTNHHSGVNETLTSLREEVLLPKGCQAIKKVLRNCTTSTRIQRALLNNRALPHYQRKG